MSLRRIKPGLAFAAIALTSVAAVGAALVSQHVYGMEPCPWCILQRVIFLAIALACVVALVARRVSAMLVVLLSLCGVAAALWQHFKAAASASCAMTVADNIVIALRLDSLWPDVFLARASCADAAVKLAGVPYEFWSLGLFIAMALVAFVLLKTRRA